eukprot:8746198-Alexandrium_andersonii.AAC.1
MCIRDSPAPACGHRVRHTSRQRAARYDGQLDRPRVRHFGLRQSPGQAPEQAQRVRHRARADPVSPTPRNG